MITFDLSSTDYGQVWLTSDWHFGHQTVLDNSQRPWKNTDRMDNALVRNLQSAVGEKDMLIVVGDMTMDGPDRAESFRRNLSRIPGTKVLVFGNHDKFRPMWYLDNGFVLAATALVLPGNVLVTHDPVAAQVWPKDKPVLCGHVHELFRVMGNVVNVGVDVWDYKPVKLEDAVALAGEREAGVDWVAVSRHRHAD